MLTPCGMRSANLTKPGPLTAKLFAGRRQALPARRRYPTAEFRRATARRRRHPVKIGRRIPARAGHPLPSTTARISSGDCQAIASSVFTPNTSAPRGIGEHFGGRYAHAQAGERAGPGRHGHQLHVAGPPMNFLQQFRDRRRQRDRRFAPPDPDRGRPQRGPPPAPPRCPIDRLFQEPEFASSKLTQGIRT